MYDPTIDAFREVPIEVAKRFLAEVPNLEAEIARIEGGLNV